MEFLFEFLMEFVLEGTIEGMKSKKVPMFLRVILFLIVASFFIMVLFMIFALGVKIMEESFLGGAILIGIGAVLLIVALRKCILFLKEREEQQDDFTI